MQLRHVRTINPAADAPLKVTAVAWCPSSTRIAVATADRVVSLFDENGDDYYVAALQSSSSQYQDDSSLLSPFGGLTATE
jgi:intraflagellar transport protein 172